MKKTILISVSHGFGGYGDFLFALKLAKQLKQQFQNNGRAELDVQLVTQQVGKDQIEGIGGHEEFGVEVLTPDVLKLKIRNNELDVQGVIEGPVLKSELIQSINDALPDGARVPLMTALEYGDSGVDWVDRTYRESLSKLRLYSNIVAGINKRADERGILLSHCLAAEAAVVGHVGDLDVKLRRALLRSASTIAQYRDNVELSFQYSHDEGGYISGKSAENYLQLQRMFCKGSSKNQDVVMLGKNQAKKKEALTAIKDKLIADGYTRIVFENMDTNTREVMHDSGEAGRVYRVLYSSRLSHKCVVAALALSGDFVGCTGDQSLSEAISAAKVMQYECLSHKAALRNELKQQLLNIVRAEAEAEDERVLAACINAMFSARVNFDSIEAAVKPDTLAKLKKIFVKYRAAVGNLAEYVGRVISFKTLTDEQIESMSGDEAGAIDVLYDLVASNRLDLAGRLLAKISPTALVLGQGSQRITVLEYAVIKGLDTIVDAIFACTDASLLNGARCEQGNTLLHRVVDKYHQCSVINRFLQIPGLDFTLRNNAGQSVLDRAIDQCNIVAVYRLIDTLAVRELNDNGAMGTCLHWAVKSKQSNVVSKLLERSDLDLALRDQYGNTALDWAIDRGLDENAIDLINRLDVAELNKQSKVGKTPLIIAVSMRRERVALKLLRKPGLDLALRDSNGKSALDLALEHDQLSVAEKIIEQLDASEFNKPNADGDTALTTAISHRKAALVSQMLAKLSLIEQRERGSLIASLVLAMQKKMFGTVEAILNQLSVDELNQQDGQGMTILHHAVRSGTAIDLTIVLSRQGVALECDGSGKTALDIAIELGNTRAVEKIIKAMPATELNKKNRVDGNTPLHRLIEAKSKDEIKLLISKPGIDLTLRNDDGHSVLDCAIKHGLADVAEMIVDRLDAEELNKQNSDGDTPLLLACKHNQEALALKILENEDIDVISSKASVLTMAVRAGMKRVAIKLCDALPVNELNRTDEDGDTAMHLAVRSGRDKIALKLMSRPGLDLANKNSSGHTAVDEANMLDGDSCHLMKLTLGIRANDHELIKASMHQVYKSRSLLKYLSKDMGCNSTFTYVCLGSLIPLFSKMRKKRSKRRTQLNNIIGVIVASMPSKNVEALRLVLASVKASIEDDFRLFGVEKSSAYRLLTGIEMVLNALGDPGYQYEASTEVAALLEKLSHEYERVQTRGNWHALQVHMQNYCKALSLAIRKTKITADVARAAGGEAKSPPVDNTPILSVSTKPFKERLTQLYRFPLEDEPFARGNFGSLYNVRLPNRTSLFGQGCQMVVKKIQTPIDSPEIQKEIAALAKLNTHMPKPYQLDGTTCIPMPKVPGMPLSDHLRGSPVHTQAERMAMVVSFFESLKEIHASNITHNDLKPSNVMFDPESCRLNIIDFGLAEVDATVLKYPGFEDSIFAFEMPPEYLQGAPASPKMDVFSSTILVAELLGVNRKQLVVNRVNAALASLERSGEPLHPGLAQRIRCYPRSDGSLGDFLFAIPYSLKEERERFVKAYVATPYDFSNQACLDCDARVLLNSMQCPDPNDRPDCNQILERLGLEEKPSFSITAR